MHEFYCPNDVELPRLACDAEDANDPWHVKCPSQSLGMAGYPRLTTRFFEGDEIVLGLSDAKLPSDLAWFLVLVHGPDRSLERDGILRLQEHALHGASWFMVHGRSSSTACTRYHQTEGRRDLLFPSV